MPSWPAGTHAYGRPLRRPTQTQSRISQHYGNGGGHHHSCSRRRRDGHAEPRQPRHRQDFGERLGTRQDRTVPAYTFGFVAGALTTVTQRVNGVTFQYLAGGFSERQSRKVFGESARMLAFFAERAGVSYPAATQSQALVARTVGQEMAGLSVVSEDYCRAVLGDPSATGLLAHELAHQWWGNMVTCRAWTELWLNEGVCHLHGRGVPRIHARPGRLPRRHQLDARPCRCRGRPRQRSSLIFPTWGAPDSRRPGDRLPKGRARVARTARTDRRHGLLERIRGYTLANFGKAVTTADLRNAMEQASATDLSEFFARWVYLR